MILKNILITGFILFFITPLACASSATSGYEFDGNGASEYPNNGSIWGHVMDNDGGASLTVNTDTYNLGAGETVYVYVQASGSVKERVDSTFKGTGKAVWYGTGTAPGTHDIVSCFVTNTNCYKSKIESFSITDAGSFYVQIKAQDWYDATGEANVFIKISVEPIIEYTVSGNTGCISDVELYQKIDGTYKNINYSTLNDAGDNYSLKILENITYKLVFSDSHEYEFTSTGNEVYNYDTCSHTQYRFVESCGNLIPDSEGVYVEWLSDSWLAITPFHESSGILDISNSSATAITLETDTFIGKTRWGIDPVVSDTTYTVINPNIAWGLKVIVQNESDDTLINDAMVKVDQTCYCTSGYSTRQKLTVSGLTEFDDMSLQDASLLVMKSGYKVCNENTTGYNVFLSGRTNFSSKTWIVKLAPSWSENVSTFYETNYSTGIHFKNENGNRTSQILDTDTEVYLYYENNNSEGEEMTLKFQSSSTHSYFVDEDSWSIPAEEIGYKTILQAQFTPWNYAYRAVIYNSSIYGWNITIPLTVRNETKEETVHYENLTTNLGFLYAHDGKIDYREDMEIATHARSNNTTLMDIDLEIWKDGALLCYKNLTAADYAGANYPYFYIYNPVFEYVSGSNYTAKMYGFDRTLLEVRYVDCITDTITRQNKLTIGVKDRAGANLDNSYIYLEDWGSLPTGSTYYNSYEGIDNGYYRYKATKSGYSGGGWSDVTIEDNDQIVWYILTEDYTNQSIIPQKLDDNDIKIMFFPLMFFLLICLVFGGFKYVTQ